MRMNRTHIIVAFLIVIACGFMPLLVGWWNAPPQSRSCLIYARQYEYDPPVLHINHGDTVHVRLRTRDVVHGFYLEGYHIDAEVHPSEPYMRLRDLNQPDLLHPVDEIVFIAGQTGKFRYRCSHTCGPLHPFMQGEMIVGPNYPLFTGLGTVTGILLAGIFLVTMRIKTSKHECVTNRDND